jgi:hypothetical protein
MTLGVPVKRRNRWQDKRLRLLKKMAAMRAAKERKRLARGPCEEPARFVPWAPLEFGVRDKVTGEVVWMDLRSGRDVARRVAVLLRHYVPGICRPAQLVTRTVDAGPETGERVGA